MNDDLEETNIHSIVQRHLLGTVRGVIILEIRLTELGDQINQGRLKGEINIYRSSRKVLKIGWFPFFNFCFVL